MFIIYYYYNYYYFTRAVLLRCVLFHPICIVISNAQTVDITSVQTIKFTSRCQLLLISHRDRIITIRYPAGKISFLLTISISLNLVYYVNIPNIEFNNKTIRPG